MIEWISLQLTRLRRICGHFLLLATVEATQDAVARHLLLHAAVVRAGYGCPS